ncbi:hypothetical protein BYT27DRAFT_7340984 [Phlegmacium glaucopus]|nr:hypothetical protein BYT27DRAFT_7340984 [Phlegmacium glaucopus]
MGGGGHTAQTLEQTEQQLLKILYENANKLLAIPLSVPDKVTFENLSTLVSAVGHQDFLKKYNYQYKGQGTVTIPAPADGRVPSATEGICSFNDVNDEGVENFVDNRILSGLELGYIKSAARADLISLGKNLFKKTSDNSWVVQDFTQDYENQNSSDDQYSRRSNSMFVWTNAKLLVDGQEAKYVYFNIPSPTKIVRDNLLKVILTNALSLKPVGPDSSGTETQRLQAILEPYLTNKFKEQNQYEYQANMTRPNDMAVSSENWVRGTIAFCLPQSNKVEDVVNYVNIVRADVATASSAMKLPKYLHDENGPAYKDLLNHFEKLLGQRTDNSWTSVAFDKSYDSPDAGENSTRTSAIMLWSNSSLTEVNITCKQLYLYYVGVYYQVISPQFAAREKLLTTLIAFAQQLDKNLASAVPDPGNKSSPQLALKIILDEYAKRQFKGLIGYDYDPKKSTPDDLAPKKKAVGISTLMYFDTSPVSVETIASKTDNSIIGQLILPSWLEEPLNKNLGARIRSNTQEARLDSWNSNLYQRQYSGPREGVLPYNVRAVITYANGQVVEDGVTVTASMVHYLGIFYPTDDIVGHTVFAASDSAAAPAPLEVEEYDNCRVTTL